MRKNILLNISLTIFLFLLNTITAQDFEGKVKFKISHDGDENFLEYFIKGENIRIEMGDNAEAVFIKSPEKSMLLMPEEEQYMDLNNSIFSRLQEMSGMGNEDDEQEEYNINDFKTGKVMTILDFECHQWIFKEKDEDEEVEAWVTDELGNFMLMSSPMGGGYSPGWSSSVKNNGFFPILVITRDEDGEESSRFEATEVDKKSLDDELFGPPSHYEEMKIPGMDSFLK